MSEAGTGIGVAILLALIVSGAIIALVLGSFRRGLRRSVAAASEQHRGTSSIVLPVAVRIEDVDPMTAAGVELLGLKAPKNLALVLDRSTASWWAGNPSRCVAKLEPDGEIMYRLGSVTHAGIQYPGLRLTFEKDGAPRDLALVILRTDTILPLAQTASRVEQVVGQLAARQGT